MAANGGVGDTPANLAARPPATPQETFEDPRLVDEAVYADEGTVLLHGDAETRLSLLADIGLQVDCIVTSPPSCGLRDYGVDGQIGLEEQPSGFIDRLVRVFALCSRVLRDTGSLWVNMGDTYWSGRGASTGEEPVQPARRCGVRPQDRLGDGLWARPKQLLLIPQRLAIALQETGWLVRNDNVWVKPRPVAEQVRDRCAKSHEYMFHFAKSRYYYFDRHPVGRVTRSGAVLPPLDTWTVDVSRRGGNHRASFSEGLVRIPVLSTTPPGGIVLDPFNGSGTTTLFARKHGFRSIGIDINREYCEQAATSIRNSTRALPL